MRLTFNENLDEDLTAILVFLEGVGYNEGKNPVAVNVSKLTSILSGIRQDFPHDDGMDKASIFKKAVTFLVYFVAEKPLEDEKIGKLNIPKEIQKIPNSLNTLLAFLIAINLINNSQIEHPDGTSKELTNKIKISKHSLIDIIDALSNATPATHFKMCAVLLEQLAYKSNCECQYEVFEL